jgi:hypothetical protein
LKLNKYNNTYQLVHTEGSYKGVDSCYLVQNEHFNNEMSSIAIDDKKRFLRERADMRARLRYLQLSEQIPSFQAVEKLLSTSSDIYNLQNSETGVEGATYVTLYDTLSMETEVEDDDRHSHQPFLPWRRALIYSHSCHQSLSDTPIQLWKMIGPKDYRLLWILCSLLIDNNILWHCCDQQASSASNKIWIGWILQYLSTRYGYKKYRKHLQRYKMKKSLSQLMWLLEMTLHDNLTWQNTPWINSCYSPVFSWNQLRYILSLLNHIHVVQIHQLVDVNDEIMHAVSISSSTHILAFFVDVILVGTTNRLISHFKDFELTNVVYTDESTLSPTAWDVTVWVRRMYVDSFDDFWVMNRNDVPTRQMLPDVSSLKKPFLLIYSRQPNLSSIQQDYLMGMGNLSNMKCPLHNKHVISAPYLCGKQCSFKVSLSKF